MLKMDPLGPSREPVAQAMLPRIRIGRKLKINLPLPATRMPVQPLSLTWARPQGGHQVLPGILSWIHCPAALALGQSPRQHQQVTWSLSSRS